MPDPITAGSDPSGNSPVHLDGLLFFPVTPCNGDGTLAPDVLAEHIRRGVEAGAGAVFACCGTGEYFALDVEEYTEALTVAVEATAGRVPVLAGVGHGTALARRFAAAAATTGVDGLLVLPPYLVRAGQAGLRRHYEELCDSTDLDVVVYQRDNAILAPDTVAALSRRRNVVGFKDGHGDLDHLQRVMTAVRRQATPDDGPFVFLNGLPTAETTALAYRAMGVEVYSSAVFCFAPTLAMAFWDALVAGDREITQTLLDEFYVPLVQLRDLGAGYAVSLVKAGIRATGLDVGPVRSPLTEPEPEHVEALRELVEHATKVLESLRQ